MPRKGGKTPFFSRFGQERFTNYFTGIRIRPLTSRRSGAEFDGYNFESRQPDCQVKTIRCSHETVKRLSKAVKQAREFRKT